MGLQLGLMPSKSALTEQNSHLEYWKGVQLLHHDRSYFAKYVRGSTLSPSEKTLLEARRLIIDHEWKEAIELLERSVPQEKLLLAEREYLLSEAFNRMGETLKGFECVRRAVPLYRDLGDFPGSFQGMFLLAINLHSQGMVEESERLLDELEPMAKTPLQKHQIFRERQLCHVKLGKISDLDKTLTRLKAEMKGLPVRHRQVTDHTIAYILMMEGEFKSAIKQYGVCAKNYRSLSHIDSKFWSTLLTTVVDNRTLPTADAVIRRAPLFFHRYAMIRELQAGDMERAKPHWKVLQGLVPELFGELFEFRQEWAGRSAFGILVKRYQPKGEQGAQAPVQASTSELLEERLVQILRDAATPVPKNRLIELLYGQPYDVSLDSRFYKLVQRTKKRFANTKILARAGAYRLE